MTALTRHWQLGVGLFTTIDNLDMAFTVTLTGTKEPNTANISVWNMTPTNRASLKKAAKLPITLTAGYGTRKALIFKGHLTDVQTRQDGPSIVIELSAGDGIEEVRHTEVAVAMPQGSTLLTSVQSCLTAMGIQLDAASLSRYAPQLAKSLLGGAALNGNAATVAQSMLDEQGLELSIQRGQAVIRKIGDPTVAAAVLLSTSTGLLGLPQTGRDDNGRTTLSVTSLLNSDITPGRLLSVVHPEFSGLFVAEHVQHTGETSGPAWHTTVEGLAL